MKLTPRTIIALACLIVQFIVFLFVLVATPVDAFRVKRNSFTADCFSMWGRKRCGNHRVIRGLSNKGFGCSGVRSLMDAAAAFAIISIIVTLAALALAILNFIGVFRIANIVALVVAACAFVTILISWACMAGAKTRTCNGLAPMKAYNFAGAFGLMVTAWCLELCVGIMLFFA